MSWTASGAATTAWAAVVTVATATATASATTSWSGESTAAAAKTSTGFARGAWNMNKARYAARYSQGGPVISFDARDGSYYQYSRDNPDEYVNEACDGFTHTNLAGEGIGINRRIRQYSLNGLPYYLHRDGVMRLPVHNFLTTSGDLSDASWSITANTTQTQTGEAFPNGENIASWEVSKTGLGTGQFGTAKENHRNNGWDIGERFKWVVWAKADVTDYIQLGFFNADGITSQTYANYDLNAGTVGTTGTDTSIETGISLLSSGWYRCEFSAVTSTTDAPGIYFSLPQTASDTRTASWNGTAGILFGRAQLYHAGAPDDYLRWDLDAWVNDNYVSLPCYEFDDKGRPIGIQQYITTSQNSTDTSTSYRFDQGVYTKTNASVSRTGSVLFQGLQADNHNIITWDGTPGQFGFNRTGNNTNQSAWLVCAIVRARTSADYVYFEVIDNDATNRSWFYIPRDGSGYVSNDAVGGAGLRHLGDGWYKIWLYEITTLTSNIDYGLYAVPTNGATTISDTSIGAVAFECCYFLAYNPVYGALTGGTDNNSIEPGVYVQFNAGSNTYPSANPVRVFPEGLSSAEREAVTGTVLMHVIHDTSAQDDENGGGQFQSNNQTDLLTDAFRWRYDDLGANGLSFEFRVYQSGIFESVDRDFGDSRSAYYRAGGEGYVWRSAVSWDENDTAALGNDYTHILNGQPLFYTRLSDWDAPTGSWTQWMWQEGPTIKIVASLLQQARVESAIDLQSLSSGAWGFTSDSTATTTFFTTARGTMSSSGSATTSWTGSTVPEARVTQSYLETLLKDDSNQARVTQSYLETLLKDDSNQARVTQSYLETMVRDQDTLGIGFQVQGSATTTWSPPSTELRVSSLNIEALTNVEDQDLLVSSLNVETLLNVEDQDLFVSSLNTEVLLRDGDTLGIGFQIQGSATTTWSPPPSVARASSVAADVLLKEDGAVRASSVSADVLIRDAGAARASSVALEVLHKQPALGFQIEGVATVTWVGEEAATGPTTADWSASGAASTSFDGVEIRSAAWASTAAATVAVVGEATTDADLGSTGSATVAFSGVEIASGTLNATGTATTAWDGISATSGTWTSTGQATGGFSGLQTTTALLSVTALTTTTFSAEASLSASFTSAGTSTNLFAGEGTAESSYAITGTATTSWSGQEVRTATLTSTAAATTSWSAETTQSTAWSSSGVATVDWPAFASIATTAFSAGSASVALFAAATTDADWTSAGAASIAFDGVSTAATSWSSSGAATGAWSGSAETQTTWASSGASVVALAGEATSLADVTSLGSATASFGGEVFASGVLSSNGVATATWDGQTAEDAITTWSSVGTATTIWRADATWTSTGTATATWATQDPTWTSAGVATTAWSGEAVKVSSWSSTSAATTAWDGASEGSAEWAVSGAATATWRSETAFTASASATTAFSSQSTHEADWAASGASTATWGGDPQSIGTMASTAAATTTWAGVEGVEADWTVIAGAITGGTGQSTVNVVWSSGASSSVLWRGTGDGANEVGGLDWIRAKQNQRHLNRRAHYLRRVS